MYHKVTKCNNIHWIKQIRYYNEEQNTCLRILNATLSYGYEYLGDNIRLIFTPETERCYRFVNFLISLSFFVKTSTIEQHNHLYVNYYK